MSDEQFQFLMAIDEYKRANSRPFPTWTEVLEVIKALGYRKVAEPQPLAEFKARAAVDDETTEPTRDDEAPEPASDNPQPALVE